MKKDSPTADDAMREFENGQAEREKKEAENNPLAFRLDRVLEQRFNKIMGGQFK